MGQAKRAPNKVIWCMDDAQDQLELARVEWRHIADIAAARMDADLMFSVGRLGQCLAELDRLVLDARHNRYRETGVR